MTKEEFKRRWESNDNGDGLTFDNIAECAKAWGISQFPKTKQIDSIRYAVLKSAGVNDAEDFNPKNYETEEA